MKRLQVLFDEGGCRRFRRIARGRGMSLAEWVRRALRAASRREPLGDRGRQLAAVRAAAKHRFPTADIDRMLREIARGRSRPGAA